MRLALLGVRGSTPAPGAEFVRYGGHTSCVAVLRDGEDTPALVLDAGTGLRGLGGLLGGAAFSGSILLSHLHWDHVQGLPFCPAVDHPAAAVDLYLPAADRGVSSADLLARAMSPPHFPIGPDGLNGRWRFLRSRTGCDVIEGYAVTFAEVPHRGGLTYGIRVESDGVAIAYLPDHAPAGAPEYASESAEALAAGVDLLLHDGQYFEPERATAHAYGHVTVDDAVQFAQRCGARRLVLTHHAPDRTDDALDELARSCAQYGPLPVEVARQDDVLAVVGQRASTRRA